MKSVIEWAEDSFGSAELGDQRRRARLVKMARRAALAPSGLVSEVFCIPAERQAAYDFLEHEQVPVHGVRDALFASTARACRGHDRVLVPIDGSSITLADHKNTKQFGHVGRFTFGAHGLKVMNALALTTTGVPLGVIEQIWWSRHERAKKRVYRAAKDRESAYWRDAATRITQRLADQAPRTKAHFIADREADASLFIKQLLKSGHEFTIRSSGKRKVQVGDRRCDLPSVMRARNVVAQTKIELPATRKRAARIAELNIRCARLNLVLRDKHIKTRSVVPLTVVWARETSRKCRDRTRLEWILLTNVDVKTPSEACSAVERYTYRWRIESMHRTWKSGVCGVEDTQLRSPSAVIKWATILAAVATRAERLRYRARAEPDAAAITEFSPDELEALVMLWEDDRGTKASKITALTLERAVRLVADVGGYVGNKNSGLPGVTTISRGLARMRPAAQVLANLRAAGKLR